MRVWHGSAGAPGGPHSRPQARGARVGGIGARRLLLGVTLAGALLAASACEVDVGVDIDVAENGSGTVSVGVSLDRAAADALGDLASQLDLSDLALAGWDVTGPDREADNLLWVRAAKRFGSAEELPAVLAEIAGPDVFRGFELRRRTAFAEQTWEVAGQVDPVAALRELFDTLAFNEGLAERIRGAVGDLGSGVPLYGLTISLNIDLPGVLRSGGGGFTWTALTADSSAETATAVRMTARQENTTAKTLRLVGLAAAALFVLALLLNVLGWWYIRRYRKRRASALMAKADSEQTPAAVAGAQAGALAGVISSGQDPIEAEIPWGPADSDATATLGDGVDWDSLTGDVEELTPAGASSGDWTASGGWTASGEESADLRLETEAVTADAEQFEAMTRESDETPGESAPIVGWIPAEQPLAFDEPDEPAAPEPNETERDGATEPAEAESDVPEVTEGGERAEISEPPESDDETRPEAAKTEHPDQPADAQTLELDETAEAESSKPVAAGAAETDEPAEPREPAEPDEAEPREPAEPDEADEADSDEAEPGEPPESDELAESGESAVPGAETDEPDEADDEARPDADSAGAAVSSTPPASALKLVVIGGWGVLFEPADPVGELLIPFVKQAGATASSAEIRESYRLATLGHITPDDLWESCGLAGAPTWTHGPYTGRMSVRAGAADFVGALLRRGIGVGCITNDVAAWSRRLRDWTGFEAMTPWVVSSDIGIRKPDPGVFEMLRRVSEIPFANCLVIDNDVRTLDAARSLGTSTALFGVPPTETPPAGNTHPAVGDFTDLLRRS